MSQISGIRTSPNYLDKCLSILFWIPATAFSIDGWSPSGWTSDPIIDIIHTFHYLPRSLHSWTNTNADGIYWWSTFPGWRLYTAPYCGLLSDGNICHTSTTTSTHSFKPSFNIYAGSNNQRSLIRCTYPI